MALVTTDAIVLRTYNLAEADRIVVCLTRTSGLVRAVARGARRMKSRFGAAFEPFTLIKLVFYEKENRELVTISQAEITKSQFALAGQLETAEILAYMAELVSEFAPPHEANERLFRMVVACIDAIGAAPEGGRLLSRYFEVWLLRLAGLFPDVRSCAQCGARIGEQRAAYLDSEEKVRCRECSRSSAGRLLWETQRTLVAIQQRSPLEFASEFAELSREAEVQLAELTHTLIVRALERRPRTLVTSSK